MKALILNSGMGKRMGNLTKSLPKCMTELYHGDTILSRQLRILSELGLEEIVITTGYQRNTLEDYVRTLKLKQRVQFIYNPLYETTNYIYSIYLARTYLDTSLLLLHGDLVFEEKVAKELRNFSESGMTVNREEALPEKDFKAVIEKDNLGKERIRKIGIEYFEQAVSAQPFYKLEHKEWTQWLCSIIQYCENGQTNCYAENAWNAISHNCILRPFDIGNQFCQEIDTKEDRDRILERMGRMK